MSLITIILQEVNLFSQFSLATESSSDSSTPYTCNTKRAHYDMKFLWHSKGALWNSHPPMFALGYVAHCSWCSQFVVAGITRCSLTHTALRDNMCEHRCFPSKPDNLNATWNQLFTCIVPAKCSELKNQKEFWSSLPHYSYFISFLLIYNTEIHCAWAGKTYRHCIYERWWP